MATPRTNAPRVQSTPLDPEAQARLRAAIKDHGLSEVASRSGLAEGTICAIAAGVGCHDSSKKLARLFLDELSSSAA